MSGTSAPWRALRWLLAATGIAAALLLTWIAVAAGLAAYHASGARSDLALLEEQVRDGDSAGAVDALASLQVHIEGLSRWLGGAPWTWLTGLPVVGDTIATATTLVQGVDAVAEPMLPATASLAAAAGSLVDMTSALQEQQPTLIAAAQAANKFADDIAGIDPATLVGPAVDPFAEVQERAAGAVNAIRGMASASALLPGLLGLDGPTDWVIVASQPAESRASGAGFFGAYGLMRGQDGQLQLLQSRPNDDASSTADLSRLPEEFRSLWGENSAYVWGHNLTRHFPYAAQLLAQTTSQGGATPAFIVALDPKVLAALLQLTGPLTAAGVTIDSRNAEAFFTVGIYEQFADPAAKDEVVLALMAAVLDELQAAPPSPAAFAAALAAPLTEQRLVAWAADPKVQEVLELSLVAGAVPKDPLELTAAINNAGGNKMDSYLRTRAVASLYGCRELKGSVSLEMLLADVPAGLPDYVAVGARETGTYGSSRQMLHVYGPPGAKLLELTVDGAPAPISSGTERGRPVWGTMVDLVPEVPRTVTATFAGDFPDRPLRFQPQPMIHATDVVLQDDRQCQIG